jgi:hypothetical protein
MTGCKVYDKNVMRAKAFEVNNPNTAAQITQRDFFTELIALCSGFSAEQLRCLFPQKPKAMSRRNALTKQIAENYEMDGTTKHIDFPMIVTLGNAKVMDFGTTECDYDNNAWLVSLDNSVVNKTEFADYYFIAILVNITQGKLSFTYEGAKVSDGSVSITNPSGWTMDDLIHAIPLITNSKTALTDFGSFIIKVRPEKKSN